MSAGNARNDSTCAAESFNDRAIASNDRAIASKSFASGRSPDAAFDPKMERFKRMTRIGASQQAWTRQSFLQSPLLMLIHP
ncbi:MAG: hypothetical protein JSR91_19435 [Proteobacteria bacterium]|nr:hypothetical protein [Pseudomonadota bacterium]